MLEPRQKNYINCGENYSSNNQQIKKSIHSQKGAGLTGIIVLKIKNLKDKHTLQNSSFLFIFCGLLVTTLVG